MHSSVFWGAKQRRLFKYSLQDNTEAAYLSDPRTKQRGVISHKTITWPQRKPQAPGLVFVSITVKNKIWLVGFHMVFYLLIYAVYDDGVVDRCAQVGNTLLLTLA